MKPVRSILAILAIGGLLSACHGYTPKTESKRDMLQDSGFKVVSLKTPGQTASFKKLPPPTAPTSASLISRQTPDPATSTLMAISLS